MPLPVLRKDFILDPYQVIESRAIGADCILLIMAALDDGLARDLAAIARDLGSTFWSRCMTAPSWTARLSRLPADRDQQPQSENTEGRSETTEELAPLVPSDRVVVGESGIYDPEDLDRLAAVGARCFLVGESLMRAGDVAAATRRLLSLPDLSHTDPDGRARMVDVSDKSETDRIAVAGARS